MKQSEVFRENAENCAHLAEGANSDRPRAASGKFHETVGEH